MSAEAFDDVGGRGGGHKRLSGKRLLLFVVLPLLLLVGAVAGLYFTGALNTVMQMVGGATGGGGEKPVPVKVEQRASMSFFQLPEMLVNLKTDSPRPVFLKLSVAVQLARAEDEAAVKAVLPRVMDSFQVYLRELRPDQLQGSAGLIRLREELHSRINSAIRPARVDDVLFREMLIQ